MKIALISDIHGNAVSLETVLADIKKESVDKTIFLGDALTLGAQPNEVVEMLYGLQCECILGNHDEFLFHFDKVKKYTNLQNIINAVEWCRSKLSTNEVDYIRTFLPSIEIPLNETTRLLCFHGSPSSNTEVLLPENIVKKLEPCFSKEKNTIFAGGHTHIQMFRQYHGNSLINVGSVGQPFADYFTNGEPHILPFAEYTILDCKNNAVEVNLKRIEIDRKKDGYCGNTRPGKTQRRISC